MVGKIITIVAVGVVGIGLFGAYTASKHPIHDLTTDFEDPPKIAAGAAPEIKRKNPAHYTGDDRIRDKTVAQIQQSLYPEIIPLFSDQPAEKVFETALDLVKSSPGFAILNADSSTGTIEATHTSSMFKFVDDFIIRIRQADGKARIDLRSKSRLGRSDLGANAGRIRVFSEALKNVI